MARVITATRQTICVVFMISMPGMSLLPGRVALYSWQLALTVLTKYVLAIFGSARPPDEKKTFTLCDDRDL